MLDRDGISVGQGVRASITLENTSNRPGSVVLQIYLRDEVSSVVQPLQRLVAFQRVHVPAHERQTVTLQIEAHAFAVRSLSGQQVIEPGWFTLMAGASSTDIRSQTRVRIDEGHLPE